MPSLRQIEANRRNALLSTGPNTPEGRTAVAAATSPVSDSGIGFVQSTLHGTADPVPTTNRTASPPLTARRGLTLGGLLAKARLIVDTRNALRAFQSEKIVRL